MRTITAVTALFLVMGCGKKSTPEPAAAPEPPAAAPAPPPAPEPEPEPEPPTETAVRPPEERPSNVDLMATVTFADGQVTKGHLVRVERSEDWFAEEGWTDKPVKLTVTLEGNGTEIEAPWSDIRSIDVAYGGKSDVNCSYDSSYTPAMYECVLKTTATARLADGKSWTVVGRHKWRFVFESGDVEEFYVHKLPNRRQEEEVPELGETSHNTELELALRNELIEMRSGHVPTKITIQPPG